MIMMMMMNYKFKSPQAREKMTTRLASRKCQLLLALWLLVQVSLSQQAGSSYLSDYLRPAKLALDKLQQSFSPNSVAPPPQQASEEGVRDAAAISATSVAIETSQVGRREEETRRQEQEPPNRNEFVKLDTTPDLVLPNNLLQNQIQDRASEQSSPVDSQPVLVVASTEASASDPTGAVPSATAADLATSSDAIQTNQPAGDAVAANPDREASSPGGRVEQVDRVVISELPSSQPPPLQASIVEPARTAPQQTSPSPVQLEDKSQQQPAATAEVATSKPSSSSAAEDAEQEAVAAVDATINFGDLFASLSDSCYDEYGNARYCEPEFENAAFEKQVEVSSECGSPPSRFCTAYLNEHNDQIRNCHICDAQHPKKRHPAAYLTDMNNSNSPTCWVSAPISVQQQNESSSSSIGVAGAPGEPDQVRSDNVSLILNLDKKYEITYVSMQFCSLKPDSLAILKSSDFGQSWQPYQFYSSQCRLMYGRQSRAAGAGPSARPVSGGELEPKCTNMSQTGGRQAGRLAFSTLEGRSGGQQAIDKSAGLQDWITATNIKIVLDRHQASWIKSSLGLAHHHAGERARLARAERNSSSSSNNNNNNINNNSLSSVSPGSEQLKTSSNSAELDAENSLTSPSDTFNYAMSDLTVGGRCKCNGHASRCIHNKEGQLQCDCRHNTAGRDCEKCAALHHDRPWQRATQFDANPCQPCNCNGHSRKCHFDAELYRLSGRRSGGVCTYCKDNTAGRHCHYCREGFTRDHSKPMSDKEACKHCDCHPIGSLGRVCNQTTGQCPCKDGVAGLQCNRCLAGYQQSSSLLEPCIKLPENDINSNPALTADEDQSATGGGVGADSEPGEKQAGAQEPGQIQPGRRAPPGGGGDARLNGNRIDDLDQLADNNSDKDDDSEPPTTSSNDLNLARKQLFAARYNGRKQHYAATNYYRSHNVQRNRHQFSREPNEDDEEENLMSLSGGQFEPLDDDDHYRYHPAARYPSKQTVYNNGYPKVRYSNHNKDFSRSNTAGRGRPAELLPSVANLDQVDDLDFSDEPNNQNNGYPLAVNALYPDDSFNQIQSAPQAPPQQQQQQQQSTLRQLQQSQRRHSSSHRHRYAGHNEPQVGGAASNANRNELACGDCQSGTRRLGFRQFCHLHYALKAAVLSKYVAEDWTRFEVEIQDVFKSAPAGPLPAYIDNMVQSDEPELAAKQARLASTANLTSTSLEQTGAGQQRLKVGTVHSIWVPTEDLACRCPRLKIRSSYLLMGSIDAKENSANSLQLDRHGVALEWRSSLQEKLIKYQRRSARGRC